MTAGLDGHNIFINAFDFSFTCAGQLQGKCDYYKAETALVKLTRCHDDVKYLTFSH